MRVAASLRGKHGASPSVAADGRRRWRCCAAQAMLVGRAAWAAAANYIDGFRGGLPVACHLRRYRDAGGVVKMIVLRAELVPRRRPCGCCCFARICSLLVRTNGSKARPWSPARRKEGRAPTSDTKRQGCRRSWLTRSDCSRTSLACGQRSASISETQTSESVPEMHLRSKFRIENERRMRKRAGKEDRMHMLPAAS